MGENQLDWQVFLFSGCLKNRKNATISFSDET